MWVECLAPDKCWVNVNITFSWLWGVVFYDSIGELLVPSCILMRQKRGSLMCTGGVATVPCMHVGWFGWGAGLCQLVRSFESHVQWGNRHPGQCLYRNCGLVESPGFGSQKSWAWVMALHLLCDLRQVTQRLWATEGRKWGSLQPGPGLA